MGAALRAAPAQAGAAARVTPAARWTWLPPQISLRAGTKLYGAVGCGAVAAAEDSRRRLAVASAEVVSYSG